MSAKVVLYIACSLDQYIATTDHMVDWLEKEDYRIENEDFGYNALLERVGSTLMGRKTFEFIEAADMPFPYTTLKNFVFSSTRSEAHDHVEFIDSPVAAFVKDLKKTEEQDIWLIGGGQVISELLEHKLVDSIILTIVPEFLGDGIPLWSANRSAQQFQLRDCDHYSNGFVQLHYDSELGQ